MTTQLILTYDKKVCDYLYHDNEDETLVSLFLILNSEFHCIEKKIEKAIRKFVLAKKKNIDSGCFEDQSHEDYVFSRLGPHEVLTEHIEDHVVLKRIVLVQVTSDMVFPK